MESHYELSVPLHTQPPAMAEAFRPLVVGAPRSGFALLTSVVIHLMPFTSGRWTVGEEVFNAVLEGADQVIAEAIVREFAARGVTRDLVYNPNFRKLTGGPKWLREDDSDAACFRKYIGVRGMGDFTLVTSHPRQVLDADEVVHSHTNPELWLSHPGYAAYTKFASVRNPIGILNSSVFSLNALASEYIQKFIPAGADNDEMRQRLALYKLTDLAFVRGLVQFLVGYLADFVKHWRRYHILRWEDLIFTPIPTIMRLARDAGIAIREEQARRVWSILDHVNLTGHHRHNYRAGKGIVGNWREWLVNEHLEIFQEMGLEPFMVELGYGPMPRLHEADYTPFQRKVRDFVRRGEISRETDDEDLFTFAFNKSNISSEAFPFRRYPWRRWTRIERSIFSSEELEKAIWDVAENCTADVNAMLEDVVAVRDAGADEIRCLLQTLERRHPRLYAAAPARMHAATAKAEDVLDRARSADPAASGRSVAVKFHPEPRLVDTISGYNIVAHGDRYYGIPQSLGEYRVDNTTADHPSVICSNELAEVTANIVGRTGTTETLPPVRQNSTPELTFIDAMPEAMAAICRQYVDAGCRRILLTPFNDFARRVYYSVRADVAAAGGRLLITERDTGPDCPADVRPALLSDAELVLVCETAEPELSDVLLEFLDCNARVVAVKTSRFWAEQPLFLISIPKSGTHLLYRLAEAMGYRPAVHLQDDPAPGHWYCVEYTNSHTSARDFFVDTVRRAPYGNRHHPFMRSPAIFIYRNPLDIVASEAQYYHREGKTAFAGYLAALNDEQRLLRLIQDPWLLGSVRDRVAAFLPWLELPNVIPVSFEELVGPRGAGDANEQRDVIWSIQLKLHLPGVPETYAAEVFDSRSPTFDTGRIGRFREVFSPEAYRLFRALPQDFMEQYGYEGWAERDNFGIPRRAGELRRRRLQLSSARADDPIAVQYSYFGYNIVRHRDIYVGLRESDQSDLRTADLQALQAAGTIVAGSTAAEVRRAIEALTVRSIVAHQATVEARPADATSTSDRTDGPPQLVREDYSGFNIIRFNGRFYAALREHGPIDLEGTDRDALISQGLLLQARSQTDIEQLIDVHRQRSTAVAALEQVMSALREELEAKNRAADQLHTELATLQAALENIRANAADTAADLERSATRERQLREHIASLLGALATRDVETAEMRKWIRQLQAQLVGRS
jgi:hypothetical protein